MAPLPPSPSTCGYFVLLWDFNGEGGILKCRIKISRCSPSKRWSKNHVWLSATYVLFSHSQKKPHHGFRCHVLSILVSLHPIYLLYHSYFMIFVKLSFVFKSTFESKIFLLKSHSLCVKHKHLLYNTWKSFLLIYTGILLKYKLRVYISFFLYIFLNFL